MGFILGVELISRPEKNITIARNENVNEMCLIELLQMADLIRIFEMMCLLLDLKSSFTNNR